MLEPGRFHHEICAPLDGTVTSIDCHLIARIRQETRNFNGTRTKRQTIRRWSPHWARVIGHEEAFPLHLWWKSRTADRCFLGRVPCLDAREVVIINQGGNVNIGDATETKPKIWRDGAVWYLDGFDRFEQFRDYFVPNPGDQFKGVLLRW
jgi:hypothetical protein